MQSQVHIYTKSIASGFRSMLPVLVSLLSIRPENTDIATSIPGLGECRSTFCKPERRVLPRP